jgi:flagellar FliL protein
MKRVLGCLVMVMLLGTGNLYAAAFMNFDEHFTTNFGDPEKPKLSYLRVNVALKVEDDAVATQVRNHIPYLRDVIIRHLVRQQVDTVRTAEAKNQMLSDILSDIQAFLTEEEGDALVQEVLFTEFIVQE